MDTQLSTETTDAARYSWRYNRNYRSHILERDGRPLAGVSIVRDWTGKHWFLYASDQSALYDSLCDAKRAAAGVLDIPVVEIEGW